MDLRGRNESRSKVSPVVASVLVRAVLEWMLILLLFIEASFAFLVTKFARYSRLQVPCLLCSRLDHVLGKEKAGFYWELICRRHKSKISSLVFCRQHGNLVDIHGTCESCLFSSTSIEKSNAKRCRLIVGKLGNGPCYDPFQDASADEHISKNCMCCNEQWIPSICTEKLFNSNSEGAEINEVVSFTSKYDVDEKAMEGSSQRGQVCAEDTDPLPHVEYMDIRVTSDAESEGRFLDNKSTNVHFCVNETLGHDLASNCAPSEPKTITLVDCPSLDKSIHQASLVTSSLEEPSDLAHNAESEVPIRHDLEGSNCQPADCKNNVDETSESARGSFPEAFTSPRVNGTHHEAPKDISVPITTEFEKEVNVGCEETLVDQNDDSILKNEVRIDSKHKKTDASTQMVESLDLGDAYRLAVGPRGRQLSGRLLEQQRSMTESTRASEDLKILLSQISAARTIDLPLYDMSPRVSANSEDYKAVDGSSVLGMQILQRRISLERNESNLSFDGSVVSEIEGESVADRLKRQVEHDKKIMSALYKELEEERNASAVAVNQAMAMITRLQEEKAALNMEALQCLRMMEEQAQYDGEALQIVNDRLAEREQLIENFEYELGLYRKRFGDISLSDNIVEPSPESGVEANSEESNVAALKHDININNDCGGHEVSSPCFEDEKQIILENLSKLEEKLIMFSKHEVYPDSADDAFSPGVSHGNGEMETKNRLPRDTVVYREASSEDRSEHNNSQHENEGFVHIDMDGELDKIRNKLAAMSRRFEALEAEKNIIESSINSLEKGSEGFEFIREVADRVQELYLAYIRRSEV
ncbi:myosin-binding protein 1-like [Andrographis paniculata]|uniref:myosin-binding protein 1-like n=1 Tax=Andrographis paniculata TaxID=175694 RepID=UPI0021E86F1C|nr:myosin-binding protein 1-like [Andrographis paniculata]XP_051147094.1 myosin-binding protein 1-like [Andrographis paniculata]